jgi:hypothetical protein
MAFSGSSLARYWPIESGSAVAILSISTTNFILTAADYYYCYCCYYCYY